jgi:hypothetical protein
MFQNVAHSYWNGHTECGDVFEHILGLGSKRELNVNAWSSAELSYLVNAYIL